jgi:phosphoenolpyruvate carboxykinase (ATP)
VAAREMIERPIEELSDRTSILEERQEASSLFAWSQHGLTVGQVHRNLPASSLYEHAIRIEKDASIAENGALVAYSGVKTGRSPLV